MKLKHGLEKLTLSNCYLAANINCVCKGLSDKLIDWLLQEGEDDLKY